MNRWRRAAPRTAPSVAQVVEWFAKFGEDAVSRTFTDLRAAGYIATYAPADFAGLLRARQQKLLLGVA